LPRFGQGEGAESAAADAAVKPSEGGRGSDRDRGDRCGRGGAWGWASGNLAFLLFSLVALTMPLYLTNSYYLSILAFFAIRLMPTIGLNLLLGQAGQISLGHAAFIGLGAYGSALLTTRWGLDPWPAMFLAALLSALVAVVIGVPALRLKGHYLAMATLGFGEIVLILLIQLKGLTGGTDGVVGIPPLELGGWSLTDPRLFHVVVWSAALIMLRMALNLPRTRTGRALIALHRTEIAASSLGIDVAFHKLQVFVVSAVFASIAGSFLAHYVMFISPEGFGVTLSVLLVAGAVIGGLAGVWGAVWGAGLMVLLPEVLARYNEDYTLLAFGLLVIVVMIFLPEGLAGAPAKLRALRRTPPYTVASRTQAEPVEERGSECRS